MFTSQEVKEKTGATDVSINRWSQKLRETHMVEKDEETGRVYYHEDFLNFIASRSESQGPSNLPEASRIAELYQLWRETEGDIDKIASAIGVDSFIAKIQLNMVGLGE